MKLLRYVWFTAALFMAFAAYWLLHATGRRTIHLANKLSDYMERWMDAEEAAG